LVLGYGYYGYGEGGGRGGGAEEKMDTEIIKLLLAIGLAYCLQPTLPGPTLKIETAKLHWLCESLFNIWLVAQKLYLPRIQQTMQTQLIRTGFQNCRQKEKDLFLIFDLCF
jgi:hypothetical protein